jgi:hypothetical protein
MLLAAALVGLLAQASPPAVQFTVEPRAESLRYRFENPSSFDTVALVPHFFEQTYDTDNVWIGVRGRYRAWTLGAESSLALTPSVTRQADDFDTFFQPDGNVVVSGTTGNASLRAWELQQRVIIGRSGPFDYGLGYTYRRDSARFHDGTKITTTSRPPSEHRETVTTREFVTSQVHQVTWFARLGPEGPRGIALLLEASPFTLGRLAVELPDKYPGRTLTFQARAAVVGAEATVGLPAGPVRLEVGARASRSFSYADAARLRISGLALVFLDTVPFSGIIRIRDMMYSVEPVPPRPGGRQLRCAGLGEARDASRDRREPQPLRADDGDAAAARAAGGEDAAKNGIPVGGPTK